MYEYLTAIPLLTSQILRYILPITINNFHFQAQYKYNLVIYISIYAIF